MGRRWTSVSDLRALTELPLHGARPAGGHDRGGDGRLDRLVHGRCAARRFAGHTLSVMAFPGAAGGAAGGAARRRPATSPSRPWRRWRSVPRARPGSGNRGQESAVDGTVQALRAGLRVPVPEPLPGGARQTREPAVRSFLGHHLRAGAGAARGRRGRAPAAGARRAATAVRVRGRGRRPRPRRARRERSAIGFLLLLGMAVAETAQITGALLVFALLVAPPATAQLLTPRTGLGLALSVILGVLDHLAGPWARLLLRIPRRLLHHHGGVRPVRRRTPRPCAGRPPDALPTPAA